MIDSVYLYNKHGSPIDHDSWVDLARVDRLGLRELGPGRRGHLGGARRAQALHLLAADVLGRRSTAPCVWRSTAGCPPTCRGGSRRVTRSTTRSWRAAATPKRQAFVQHYDTESLDAAVLLMPLVNFVAPTRPALAVDARRDGERARQRQPRLPLQRRGLARRARGRGGDVLDLHVLVRRGARARGPRGRGAARVREDAHLRQPPRALLRGDRARPGRRSATSPRRSPTWR